MTAETQTANRPNVGDKVYYVIGKKELAVELTITRVTATQFVTNDGSRWIIGRNRTFGGSQYFDQVGGRSYVYVVPPEGYTVKTTEELALERAAEQEAARAQKEAELEAALAEGLNFAIAKFAGSWDLFRLRERIAPEQMLEYTKALESHIYSTSHRERSLRDRMASLGRQLVENAERY